MRFEMLPVGPFMRDRSLQQIALRFGARWVSCLRDLQRVDPSRVRGGAMRPHHLLPFDAQDVAATRAWLSMTQLARDDEAIGQVLAQWEAREVEEVILF